MTEVEQLIPHRDPFLYVDNLDVTSGDQIIGTKIFSNTDQFLRGSFPEFNFVPGVILIESMAQCGGAGIKKLGLADGAFGFASIESARFYKGVEYQKTFRMVIRNIKVTDRYFKQSGVGFVDDEVCLDLIWTCIRFV